MSTPPPNAINHALNSMSHQELLDLVLELYDECAEVRRLLLARLDIAPQIIKQQPRDSQQVKTLKREISNFFHDLASQQEYQKYSDYDREYDEDEEYPELDSLFETAKILNLAAQIEVYWYIVTCGNEMFESEEYFIGTEQIERAIGLFAEAVEKLELNSLEKQPYFNSLLAALDWNFCSYGDITKALKNALDAICTVPEDYRYLIE